MKTTAGEDHSALLSGAGRVPDGPLCDSLGNGNTPTDDSPQAKTSLLEELSQTFPYLRRGREPSRLARETES